MGGSPKAPKPTQQQLDLESMQREQSAKLDATENDRRKRLLNAAEGIRSFRGSALFRAAPSDTAGTGASQAASPNSGGGGGGASANSTGVGVIARAIAVSSRGGGR